MSEKTPQELYAKFVGGLIDSITKAVQDNEELLEENARLREQLAQARRDYLRLEAIAKVARWGFEDDKARHAWNKLRPEQKRRLR